MRARARESERANERCLCRVLASAHLAFAHWRERDAQAIILSVARSVVRVCRVLVPVPRCHGDGDTFKDARCFSRDSFSIFLFNFFFFFVWPHGRSRCTVRVFAELRIKYNVHNNEYNIEQLLSQ